MTKKHFVFSRKGQTTGIFQFESAPMREYLKKLKPTSISDLAAMNALYRPGPMEFIDDFIDRKYGLKEVVYLHPILEPILKETYGVIVYQEQVIQIANKVGGMSLAEADILRRAMGKKDLNAMKEQKEKFIQGASANNISLKVAGEIFDAIDKFANYGFNKSHAVAYSYLAYQTAYLKAHFTAEFLAANLTNELENTTKVTSFLEDCRKLKIEVRPPDVNRPSVYFDVVDGKIIFGMSAIKNVGVHAVEEIINSRNKAGRNFTSLFDFCLNTDTRIVNKRVLEALVCAGAFDSIDKLRAKLYNAVETALEFASRQKNSKVSSPSSLFGEIADEIKIQEPSLPEVQPWSAKERLSQERQYTGFYISGHPLQRYELEYKNFTSVHLGETEQLEGLEQVRVCGVITEIKTKIDRAGKTMAFLTIDDFSGSCECLMFSKIYAECGQYLKEEECVFVYGKPESSGDAIKIHIENLFPLKEVRDKYTESIRIHFNRDIHPIDKINLLRNICLDNKGSLPLYLHLMGNGSRGVLFDLQEYKINPTDNFINSVNELLGEDSVQLISSLKQTASAGK